MGKLAEVLQKYYIREGNRFVFRSGKTLNQLALEMWERLGCRGVDASVLSKVLQGKRLLTPQQVGVFSDLVKTSTREQEELQMSLQADYLAKAGIELNDWPHSNVDLNDLFRELLDRANSLRYTGRQIDSLEQSQFLEGKISAFLDRMPNTTKEEWLGLLAKAIYLEGRGEAGICPVGELGKVMMGIVRRLQQVGKELKSREILGMASQSLADTYYILGNYSTSPRYRHWYVRCLRELPRAFELIEDKDEYGSRKIMLHRLEILVHAYLGDRSGFERARARAEIMVQKTKGILLWRVARFYEGISRAQALLGLTEAAETHEQSRKYFEAFQPGNERAIIALTRNQLEVHSRLRIKGRQRARQAGKEGLIVARGHQDKRHVQQIKRLMEKLES